MISIKQIQNGWLVQINDAGWYYRKTFEELQVFLREEVEINLLTS